MTTPSGRSSPPNDDNDHGWGDVIHHIVDIAKHRLWQSDASPLSAAATGAVSEAVDGHHSVGHRHGSKYCPGSIYCVTFGGAMTAVVHDVLQALIVAMPRGSHAPGNGLSGDGPSGLAFPARSLMLSVNGLCLGGENGILLSAGAGEAHVAGGAAAHPLISTRWCDAGVHCGGRREEHRVVYRGTVTRTGAPQMILPRSLSGGEHDAATDMQSVVLDVLRIVDGLLATTTSHGCSVLFTMSLSLAMPTIHPSALSAGNLGEAPATTTIDIHFMTGSVPPTSSSGNVRAVEEAPVSMPEAVALYDAQLQSNHPPTVSEHTIVSMQTAGRLETTTAIGAAMFAFWRPFLMLLHPAHRDAVVVSVASANCLIELHRFQEALQRMFRSMMSVPCATLPLHGSPSPRSTTPFGASLFQQELQVLQLRLHCFAQQHRWMASLIGETGVDDVFSDAWKDRVGRTEVVDAHDFASPPPKEPPHCDTGRGLDASREITVVQQEAVALDWVDRNAGPDGKGLPPLGEDTAQRLRSTEPSMPNTSAFVMPQSAAQPTPRGKAVSVFDRLLATPAASTGRRTSLSPSANTRKPFVGGGTAAPPTHQAPQPHRPKQSASVSHQTHNQDAANAATPTINASSAEWHQQALLREQQHRFSELERQFNDTVVALTKESEGKLIAKERELARLADKLSAFERAAAAPSLEGLAVPPQTPAQSNQRIAVEVEEEVAALRSAQAAAEKALKRTQEDKDRIEQLFEFHKKDTEARVEYLENKLKKQREAFALELAQTKHEEAEAQGSRFQLAREALERQIASLSDQVQLLKGDKKNLVSALRSLEQARREEAQDVAANGGPGGGGGERPDVRHANGSSEANEVHAQLSELLRTARGQLKAVVEERDGLMLSGSEKDSQLSTMRTTVEMLRSQLARERAAGPISASSRAVQDSGVATAVPPTSAQAILSNVQRRLPSASHVTSAARSGSTSSPMRPGVAHYLMQQRVDPTELISPRKVPR